MLLASPALTGTVSLSEPATRVSDVIVVGGGAIGVAVSHELAKSGADVVLVETRESVGAECSFGNAGLVVPSHCIPLARPGVLRQLPGWVGADRGISIKPRVSIDLLRFGLRLARSSRQEQMLSGLRVLRDLCSTSRDLFEDFARDGLDFSYRRDGVMNVCATQAAFDELCADAELLRREGFEPLILTTEEARLREPLLKTSIAGAVYWREDASCIPDRFVARLAERAQNLGARFRFHERVTGFERSADGSINAVRTDQGKFTARTVVLAAGAWTARLARLGGSRIPMEPGKGYHAQLRAATQNLRVPLLFQEAVLAATPMADSLRLAGTMEFAGIDVRLHAKGPSRLLGAARAYLDGFETSQPYETWCGLRPCTPDSLPIVGRSVRSPNLIFATGHGMLGLTLAPVTARIVSDIVFDRASEAPVAALSPSRFRA